MNATTIVALPPCILCLGEVALGPRCSVIKCFVGDKNVEAMELAVGYWFRSFGGWDFLVQRLCECLRFQCELNLLSWFWIVYLKLFNWCEFLLGHILYLKRIAYSPIVGATYALAILGVEGKALFFRSNFIIDQYVYT